LDRFGSRPKRQQRKPLQPPHPLNATIMPGLQLVGTDNRMAFQQNDL
jgi:hypothetical protein